MNRQYRENWAYCPICARRVVRFQPSTGDVELADGARVGRDYRGPMGGLPVVCPRGHEFPVGEALPPR